MKYTVSWTVIVEADGPIDAAVQARDILENDASATVWTVTDEQGNSEIVEA